MLAASGPTFVRVAMTVPAVGTANGNCWAPLGLSAPVNVSVTDTGDGVVVPEEVVLLSLHAAVSGAMRHAASTSTSRRIGRNMTAPYGRVSLTIRHPRAPNGLARGDCEGRVASD